MYGLQLGLYPPSNEVGLLPVRSIHEMMEHDDQWMIIMPNAVYCGEGCVRLALRRTVWSNEYKIGKDGGSWEVVVRYGLKFLEQGTAAAVARLRLLQDKVLITDAQPGEPCHAKLISAMYQYYVHKVPLSRPRLSAQSSSGKSRPYVHQVRGDSDLSSQGGRASWSKVPVSPLEPPFFEEGGLGVNLSIHRLLPPCVAVLWPQETIAKFVYKCFPDAFLRTKGKPSNHFSPRVPIPFLEDILNRAELKAWMEWDPAELVFQPYYGSRRWRYAGLGRQEKG